MEPLAPQTPPPEVTTPEQPVVSGAAISPTPAVVSVAKQRFAFLRKIKPRLAGEIALVAAVVLNMGLCTWLLVQRSHTMTPVNVDNSAKSAIQIDTKTGGVGVSTAAAPSGLQSEAVLDEKARGNPNVRSGLLNNDPYTIYEDSKGKQWKLGVSGGELQFGAVGGGMKTFASLTQTNTSAPTASGPVTVQGSTASLPMNFSVTGAITTTGNITSGARLIVANGSAGAPALSFAGAGSSGLYMPGGGAVSTSVNGVETLRVESGSVTTMSGANLQISGYLRAGTDGSSPYWRVARYTGTLDGSGEISFAHGITNGHTRILSVTGFYRGNGGEARSLAIDSITATTVELVGGAASRPYRVTIIYAADSTGW